MRKLISDTMAGSVAVYVVVFVAVVAQLCLFSVLIGETTPVVTRGVVYCGDAFLLLSGYWLLRGRLRRLVLVGVWCVTLFLLANLLYFRYWGDLIPFESIVSPASYNMLVMRGGMSMLRWVDMVFVAASAVATVAVWRAGDEESEWLTPWRAAGLTAASLLLWAGSVAFSNWRMMVYWNKQGDNQSFAEMLHLRMRTVASREMSFHSNGLACYVAAQVKCVMANRQIEELSAADRELIERVVARGLSSDAAADSLFAGNEGKNLIFIVVESLNSDVVGRRVAGRSVTPVLDSLLEAEGTVAALDVTVEIGDGGSSDGQLIYNTGLRPLLSGVTALSRADMTYPSLVKSIAPAGSAEFIIERKSTWNHGATSVAYGYDVLHDADSLALFESAERGMDGSLMAYALSRLPKMPRPFVAEMTTLSTHSPFDDGGVDAESWPTERDFDGGKYERNYLRMIHYFDSRLGRFIEGLKREGLWEQSVVVIASDHDIAIDSDARDGSRRIVFMALNTGMTRRVEHGVRQGDVYPTVLDMMHVDGGGYRGTGYSMVRDDYAEKSRAVTADEAARASDLMIRSDYFAGQDGRE